jgi:TolB-like protein/DNA-binding winged helix-turn-helix (wHTH) protein
MWQRPQLADQACEALALARMDLASEPKFSLGRINVSPATREVTFPGGRDVLEPRVMEVLVTLARANGEVLSRDALIEACWDGRVVSDDAINRVISRVRKVSELTQGQDFVLETIARVGYRLVVKQAEPAPAPVIAAPTAPASEPAVKENSAAAPGTAERPGPTPVNPPGLQEAGKTGHGRRILIAAMAAALILGAVVFVGALTRWGAPARERSIAVLPFASESVDTERAYLGRVLSGEVIDILSQLKGMEVIARNSSFTFGADADVLEVGRKLGVAHVLSGVVREEGENVEVSATLADAKTGRVIWTFSDKTRFAPEKVPALQKAIAERVAGAMSIAFNVPASSRLTGGSTKNLEAYNSYLRGLGYWWSGGPARDAFARATELDPEYAEAWAGLAITTASDSLNAAEPQKARDIQNAAYAMAERGVKLAPDLSVTQACYGALSTTQNKWQQAEVATLKAMEISRGDLPMNHRQNTLSRVGRASESYQLMQEQKTSDPLSSGFGAFRLMGVLPATGRQAELLEIATSQDWFGSKGASGQMYGLMARVHAHQPVAAIAASLQSLAQQPDRALADFAAGLAAVIDEPDKARAYLRTAYDDPAFQHAAKWEILPFLAAWLGDDELVLRAWRDQLPVNTMRTIYIWGEAFAGARARPEFKQLARDLGLVDYWRAYRWADTCRPLAGDDFVCG